MDQDRMPVYGIDFANPCTVWVSGVHLKWVEMGAAVISRAMKGSRLWMALDQPTGKSYPLLTLII